MRFKRLRDRLRKLGFEFDEDILGNATIKGGEITISKYFDFLANEDICKHDWRLIEEKREVAKRWGWDCEVYVCATNGCVKFKFLHRTSFLNFLYFFLLMPAIRELLPMEGAFYTPYLFSKEFRLPKEALPGYLELIEGLDIDGRLAYIKVGSKIIFYRYDPYSEDIVILPYRKTKKFAIVFERVLHKMEAWTLK